MKRRRKKKKWLKWTMGIIGGIIILFAAAFSIFMYKVKNGFPFYEEEMPAIQFPQNQKRILLFSKANAFVHTEAIEVSKPIFKDLAAKNDWFLFEFDEGGVFNEKQLDEFDVVIWNNVSGKVLTNEQRRDFQHYIENGGSYIGIHAAGDNSHHWDWYTNNLIGAKFSHHPIKEHIQEAELHLVSSNPILAAGLPKSFKHNDEWYVFEESPSKKGAKTYIEMDGESINPDGNFLWIKNKNFGMGEKHPNVWHKKVGKGKALYSALGHDAGAFNDSTYVRILENAIKWSFEK